MDNSMIGRVISHDKITEKNTQGGLAEVLLAEDTILTRRAAMPHRSHLESTSTRLSNQSDPPLDSRIWSVK